MDGREGGQSKHVTAGFSCSQSGVCSAVTSRSVRTELGCPLFSHPCLCDLFGLCHSPASSCRRGTPDAARMTHGHFLRGGSAQRLRAEVWREAAWVRIPPLPPTASVTFSELFNPCSCFCLCKKRMRVKVSTSNRVLLLRR